MVKHQSNEAFPISIMLIFKHLKYIHSKSRSNRGWFHKLRWIHVKVDTKHEGIGFPKAH